MDTKSKEIEIESKCLEHNLLQFFSYNEPGETNPEYIEARPRVLRTVILKLDFVLSQLRAHKYCSPKELNEIVETLESLGYKNFLTVSSVLDALADEILNLKRLDREMASGDLERARTFCDAMAMVFVETYYDAPAKLRIV